MGNNNNDGMIMINKSVIYGIAIVLVTVAIFGLGVLTAVGISHHNKVTAESVAYEMKLADKEAEEEAKKDEHLQKLNSVSSNINRDLNADLYAIKIYAISDIAAEYQTAKMSETLSDPTIRAKIYTYLEKAIDNKTQEYLEIYDLAYEKAYRKHAYYKSDLKKLNYTQEKIKENLRNMVYYEQQWQWYNQSELKKKSDELKTELGNKLLNNEEIF